MSTPPNEPIAQNPVVAPSVRPPRRAKTLAMQHIREYNQRQAAAQQARHEDAGAPKYDEYGLLDTDSDDSDYEEDDVSEESDDDDSGISDESSTEEEDEED